MEAAGIRRAVAASRVFPERHPFWCWKQLGSLSATSCPSRSGGSKPEAWRCPLFLPFRHSRHLASVLNSLMPGRASCFPEGFPLKARGEVCPCEEWPRVLSFLLLDFFHQRLYFSDSRKAMSNLPYFCLNPGAENTSDVEKAVRAAQE